MVKWLYIKIFQIRVKPEKPFPDTRIFYPEKQGISSPVYPTRLYRP